MKTLLTFLIAFIVVAGGVYWYTSRPAKAPVQPAVTSIKDISYTIDGTPVKLVAGHASVAAAPGSASMITTDYFGNEATGDLNGDGVDDTAFLLTQITGGSGTFYYVVVALKTPTGYQGTNAVLLGDRIAPQTTQIEYGEVVVNYADRKAGEPMTTQPSVGVSKYLAVNNGTLAVIPANMYAAGNLLLGTNSSAKLGKYLIGSNGMTLYAIAKDAPGTSECVEQCAVTWPPYLISDKSALTNIQAGIGGTVDVFVRSDKSLQVSYNGMPLYFYSKDTKSGDTLGQGVGKMWAVVKPTAPTATSGGAGAHCGGNMANAPTCATGFHCAPAPGSNLPFGDVGGLCVADSASASASSKPHVAN